MDTKNQLFNMCKRIAEEIGTGNYKMEELEIEEWGGPCAGHYLTDALDIEYTLSSTFNYLGARICVALGGPNIYIDTRHNLVQGYWGGDRAEVPYLDELGIDDYCCSTTIELGYDGLGIKG